MKSVALVSAASAPVSAAIPPAAPQLVPRKTTPVAVFPKSAERIPALDGLRGIAILLVLLRHSVAGAETTSPFWSRVLEPLRLTWSGVDLFFVLSGFLIGGILLDARQSPHYFQTFYIRRAFRILPVYGVFLALYLGRHLAALALGGALGQTSHLPIPWFSFLTFTQNFWMVAFGWFGPMAIAPTWSLAVEEQFYLTVPILIRKLRTRALYAVVICFIAIAPVLRAILPRLLVHGDFACYVLMPCRADALALGILAALLVRNAAFRAWINVRRWVLHVISVVTFSGIAFLTYRAWYQYAPPMSTWGLSCLALFYFSVLLAVVCGTNAVADRFLRNSWLMRLGTIAYCTYLIHSLLIQIARRLLESHSSLSWPAVSALGGIAGVLAALLIASVSWKYFEKPLLRHGHEYQY